MAIGETTEERGNRLDLNETMILMWFKNRNISLKQLGEYHYLAAGVIDYWPKTGLFIHRKTKKRGRGKKALARAVEKEITSEANNG